jgi:hypothetical protein
MISPPTTIEIITVVALIVGPALSVLITLWYQRRTEKRAAKERLFAVLMAHRRAIPTTIEWVQSLNLIDVVFQDCPSVVIKWRELYDLMNHPNDQINWNQVGHARIELLSEIAVSLGYRRLRQTDIDRFYMPQSLVDQATMQGDIQKEFLRVLKDTKNLQANPKKFGE